MKGKLYKFQTALLIAVLALFATVSCTRVKIASVRDASYSSRPKKVFIIDGASKDFPKNFGPSFCDNMSKIMKECEVDTRFYMRSTLDLDPNGLQNRVLAFAPDLIMIVDFAGGTTLYGVISSANYDIKLLDPVSKKYIWRARVWFKPDGTPTYNARVFAEEITNKLKEDKILLGCPLKMRD